MDVRVQIGQTKAMNGTKLLAESLTSAQKEKVVFLLQIQGSLQDSKTLEKEALAIVEHALLETEGDAATRLDGTLKELNGLFKGLLLSGKLLDVHAILSIVDSDRTLHVSHAGRAEAYVIRGGTASQITEYTRGKPTPAFIHIASGPLEPRDVVVLSTQRLLRTFTPAQLAQLTHHGDQILDEVKAALESEKESAGLSVVHIEGAATAPSMVRPAANRLGAANGADRRRRGSAPSLASRLPRMPSLRPSLKKIPMGAITSKVRSWVPNGVVSGAQEHGKRFMKDLKDPSRRRRAHLLLLASIMGLFLIVWATVNLSTYSQRSKTRAELEQLITEIEGDIGTAENRYLTGDVDAANAILQRAEERAKQVMDNENKLFRTEAHDLLGRIRSKSEEVNNIVRLAPRVVVNLTSKNPDITAVGLIGINDGEFLVYDHQDLYRIILNSIDDPERVTDNELILRGAGFPRYQTTVFQTNSNSLIELIGDQPTSMKTEDPAGWITGKDIEAYLRFLYVLSPENNQIYKYERFSNRYSPPSQYNVNGELTGALDMVIDGNVYVLKQGGEVVKLFRGEQVPFVIRHLPGDILATATKLYKNPEGNIYFLDGKNRKVVVVTDGGATGESSYVRQYALEGEIGELQDLYVDPDEARLYVMDEKRLYAIDLTGRSSSAPSGAESDE